MELEDQVRILDSRENAKWCNGSTLKQKYLVWSYDVTV